MKKLALAISIGMVLSACGGGGSSSNNNESTTTPEASPSTYGSIEKVNNDGSIMVSGNRFDVSKVELNDSVLADFEFTTSMENTYVHVTSDGTVTLEPTFVGRVSDINQTSFSVNGVELEYAAFSSDIQNDDWILVSAQTTASADYNVTSVVKIDVSIYPDLEDYSEIEGLITTVEATTFTIGRNTIVDFSHTEFQPRVGQWVEVEGWYNNSNFIATEIELEEYDHGDSYDDSDIEGIVTSVEKTNDQLTGFTLNYRGAFAVNASTCFTNDDSNQCDSTLASKLVRGVEVEVVASRGTAKVVEFEIPDQPEQPDIDDAWEKLEFECEGIPFNLSENTFTMPYCENGLDQAMTNKVVQMDVNTTFKGLTQDELSTSRVEVEGITINGRNLAREIELEDFDD